MIPPSINYLFSATSSASSTSYFFAGYPLGQVATDRMIIVGVGSKGIAAVATSLTIDGVSATRITSTGDADKGVSLWIANVTTGNTLGNYVVGFGTNTQTACAITAWWARSIDLSNPVWDSNSFSGALTTTALASASESPTVGYSIANSSRAENDWTGLTENFDNVFTANSVDINVGAASGILHRDGSLTLQHNTTSAIGSYLSLTPKAQGLGYGTILLAWVQRNHLKTRSFPKAYYQELSLTDQDPTEVTVVRNWIYDRAVLASFSPAAGQLLLSTTAPVRSFAQRPLPLQGNLVLSPSAPLVTRPNVTSPLKFQSAWASRLGPRQGAEAFYLKITFGDPDKAEADVFNNWFFFGPTQQHSGTVSLAANDLVITSPVVGKVQYIAATYPYLGFYTIVIGGNPVLLLANNPRPLQGNLALSPTAPTPVRTQNHFISPGPHEFGLSPTAPVMTRTQRVFSNPAARDLTLTRNTPTVQHGTTVSISPTPRMLLLSPTAGAVTRTQKRFVNPPQGNVALSPTAPTVARTTRRFITPLQGNVALSSAGPTLAMTNLHVISPLWHSLILVRQFPTAVAAANHHVNPPQGNVALSPTAPSVARTANHFVSPFRVDLALTRSAPTLVQKLGHFVSPLLRRLALSSAPTEVKLSSPAIVNKSPPSHKLLLSETASVVLRKANHFVLPNQGNVALSSVAPAVSSHQDHPFTWDFPTRLQMTRSVPQIAHGTSRSLVIPQGNVVLTRTPSTIDQTHFIRDHFIFPPQGNLALSEYPAFPGRVYYPGGGNLVLTGSAGPAEAIGRVSYWRRLTYLYGQVGEEQLKKAS
jgi:hypothetical protein